MKDYRLLFIQKDEWVRDWYHMWEAEIDWWYGWYARILKNTNTNTYSVYVKRYATEWMKSRWYMEISSQKATSLAQATNIAEKMYDIVLWYKVPWPWKE